MGDRFIIKRYVLVWAEDMQEDMNNLYEEGYYPKEINLSDYQNKVDATVIYESRF